MSRTLSRWQALGLGIVVTAGLGLGGWGLFRIGQNQGFWADTFTVRAGFAQVSGVTVGTPVRIRGVDAGTVAAVELPGTDEPGGQVCLVLRLDRKYQHLLFADATASIESEGMIGGRVVVLDTGTKADEPLPDGALIASRTAAEMADVMRQATAVLREVRESNGTLGQLVRNDEAYREMLGLLRESQELMKKSQTAVGSVQDTVTSVKQDADAIKKMPLVRGYVTDSAAILIRPDCTRLRQVFATADLFEPQRSILTDGGKKRLDEVGAWLVQNRQKNSEVVVVAFADPLGNVSGEFARRLTEMQSETVLAYLRDNHKAQKTGWWWWSTRKVTALGHGATPTPLPEPTPLPASRVEIIVFVPPET
jgi:phospholipid/cholesterol/gamma-HCH transport system substrate-binding protein